MLPAIRAAVMNSLFEVREGGGVAPFRAEHDHLGALYGRTHDRHEDCDVPAVHCPVPDRCDGRGRPGRRNTRRPGGAAVRGVHVPKGACAARDACEPGPPAPQLEAPCRRHPRADQQRPGDRGDRRAVGRGRRPSRSQLGRAVHRNVEHRLPHHGRDGRRTADRARVDDVLLGRDHRPAGPAGGRRAPRHLARRTPWLRRRRRVSLRGDEPGDLQAVPRGEPREAPRPRGRARRQDHRDRPSPYRDGAPCARPSPGPSRNRRDDHRRVAARPAARGFRRRRVRTRQRHRCRRAASHRRTVHARLRRVPPTLRATISSKRPGRWAGRVGAVSAAAWA